MLLLLLLLLLLVFLSPGYLLLENDADNCDVKVGGVSVWCERVVVWWFVCMTNKKARRRRRQLTSDRS